MGSMFDSQGGDDKSQTSWGADQVTGPTKPSGQMPSVGTQASWDQLHQHTQHVVRATNTMRTKFIQIFGVRATGPRT